MNKKTFDIDIDSLEECQKMLAQLKSIIGQLRCEKHGSKNQLKQQHFNACTAIFNTDISCLYDGLALDQSKIYYVYTHSEPNRNIAVGKCGKSTFGATLGMTKLPFYIGKGVGNRAQDLNRNETHRKVRQKLHKFGNEIVVEKIYTGLSEMEALMIEAKLIDIFGLIPEGGRLVNLDEGIKNKERRQMYKAHLCQLNDFYRSSV